MLAELSRGFGDAPSLHSRPGWMGPEDPDLEGGSSAHGRGLGLGAL